MLRRLQRRPARRRRADPAARPVRRGGLHRAAAGHGPLRAVRPRPHLERRVRHRRGPGASSAGCVSYSPYHRVADGVDYPAVLFTIFDSDTRVDPLHARKMAAALQHATAGPRPILLRRERDVGHGARSVSRTVRPERGPARLPRRPTGPAAVIRARRRCRRAGGGEPGLRPVPPGPREVLIVKPLRILLIILIALRASGGSCTGRSPALVRSHRRQPRCRSCCGR